ncbi:MAG: MarR family transcriptional regulator [Verrucomicrobia bacterium]|nr:MarR family transcriptional regulator [Verrucomicrobiota bacterium]
MKILNSVPPTIWFIRKQMRRHRKGLSVPQFRALYFINDNPAVSLTALAEHLAASLPIASRMMAALELQKLIKRGGGKNDRRVMELAITAKGLSVLDSARRATLAQIDGKLAQLSDAQRISLGKSMDLLRKLFGPERNS